MKITIRLKLISIVSILVLVVLGLTITQSVNAWRQRSAAVQFGSSEAAASAVLEAGSLMAVERGTTNAVLAAAQIDPAQRANAARAREAAAAGLAAALDSADAAGLNTTEAKAALRQLETARQTAWAAIEGNGKREAAPWFGSATRAIEAVLILAQRVGEILPSTAEARLADGFTLTGNLAEMAEYMGRERGLMAGVIAGGKPLTSLQTELLGRAEGAVTVSGISAQVRSSRLGPEFDKAMTPVKSALERMNGELARIVDASNNAAAYPMDSATWFKTASVLIEDVLAARRGVEELIRKDIDHVPALGDRHAAAQSGAHPGMRHRGGGRLLDRRAAGDPASRYPASRGRAGSLTRITRSMSPISGGRTNWAPWRGPSMS